MHTLITFLLRFLLPSLLYILPNNISYDGSEIHSERHFMTQAERETARGRRVGQNGILGWNGVGNGVLIALHSKTGDEIENQHWDPHRLVIQWVWMCGRSWWWSFGFTLEGSCCGLTAPCENVILSLSRSVSQRRYVLISASLLLDS